MALGPVSMEEILQVSGRIAEAFQPERVILFGSHARRTATTDSDVDLLVILRFEGRNLEQALEILKRVTPGFPVDLLVRNPEDTRRRYREGDPLIRDALDNGIVLYERHG
jgi:predicted nucleotidyltransferase